jgi:anti-sigma B factor antagonist
MDRPKLALRHEPIREHPDAVLVTVDGSIDPKTVNGFKTELDALLKKGLKRFVLDCSRLTYVNSSGLAYLLNLVGGLTPQDGMVALTSVDSKILVIFNMMGITQLFRFYPAVIDAVREMDQKLARQLRDVGPAIRIVEEPPPPPPSRSSISSASTKSMPKSNRTTRRIRYASPPPQENGFIRFLRALFGMEETTRSGTTRLRKRRS